MKWWVAAMKKYTDFSGRARRAEYWMFTLLNFIIAIVTIVLDNVLGTASEELGYGLIKLEFGLIFGLFGLATIIPALAVTVRRLHDVGKSGWWMFISLIPLIGCIWLFVLTVTDSQTGDN